MAREAIVFLSPVRWDDADQAWRRLPTRCARDHQVIVLEAPQFDATEPELEIRRGDVLIATPRFDPDTSPEVVECAQRVMLQHVFRELGDPRAVLWYRHADALAFTHHLMPRAIVYDPGRAGRISGRDQLLRQHADVVLADPARDLAWEAAWPLLDRAISARLGAAAA